MKSVQRAIISDCLNIILQEARVNKETTSMKTDNVPGAVSCLLNEENFDTEVHMFWQALGSGLKCLYLTQNKAVGSHTGRGCVRHIRERFLWQLTLMHHLEQAGWLIHRRTGGSRIPSQRGVVVRRAPDISTGDTLRFSFDFAEANIYVF